ncbi:MAG: threonine synthase [Gemmatimonadaceae bacterium]
MSPRTTSMLHCEACGAEYGEGDARTVCDCGGLLSVVHRPPNERGTNLRARFASRRDGSASESAAAASGVWRYRELVMPAAEQVVSHPEGNTPLLTSSRVASWAGVRQLRLKHEGHNPTGSFKDRGMTVAITQAVRVGARAVGCASTGNTSASLAAYAALGGLRAVVLVPEGQIALGKIAQTIAHGARTLAVRGDFDACLRLVREAQSALGVYLVNSLNPWRIEGQKTIVAELLQQLDWKVPDWIVLPAGNLGNTAAFGKALTELRALDLIDRLPRLAAVQAEGAAPFASSFAGGFAQRIRVQPKTVASAIRIGDPASYDRAVAAIRATDGVVTAVPDEDLLEAKAVVDASGIGCEPASAASVAGTRRLVRQGIVKPDDHVVAVLTGHLLKDPETVLEFHRQRDGGSTLANAPISIEPTLSALEAAVFSRT